MKRDETFFVTIKRGGRTGFLLGPYATLEEAEGHVAEGRQRASEADSWSDFDAFGVTGVTCPETAAKIRPVFGPGELS